MMYGRLPITIPINATEDRVIGGWQIDELMRGHNEPQAGLLEEANGGLLYVDEVNLLDDHVVNIILDVTSTGILLIQREGRRDAKQLSFAIVGTMNPEEGGLRPQLLDRFGLMVSVTAEQDEVQRSTILQRVLAFDEADMFLLRHDQPCPFLEAGRAQDAQYREIIERARHNLYTIAVSENIVDVCVKLAKAFNTEGHRSDYVMALAARAYAALNNEACVTYEHVKKAGPMALQHRRPEATQGDRELWSIGDEQRMVELLSHD